MAWEKVGSNSHEYDPNWDGDGAVMAWKAGAKLSLMEYSQASSGGRRYPSYGTGNANNTWFPATIVDANGKEIPWVDRDDRPITTVPERNLPVEGQKLWMPLGIGMTSPYETCGPLMVRDLRERIMSGEFKLPFYADMTQMPDYERRAIFGLMVGNEGKTAVPIYKTLKDAGFDPAEDMLMVNVLHPQYAGANEEPFWDVKLPGVNGPNMRDTAFGGYGGLVCDWDLRSSLEGLYAAGSEICGVGGASFSASTGRYAGRTAATWALSKEPAAPSEEQIAREKKRIYKYVQTETGYGWKEVQLGLCRVMQDYCGDYKNDDVLEMGLWWLDSIRHGELDKTAAANPHELGRTLGAETRLDVCEIILRHCLARKSSAKMLNFERLDYPEQSSEKFAMYLRDGEIQTEPIPEDFYAPEGTYREMYVKHACLEGSADV
jgi:succinate dehydrogenase/fumarate reductase flavoprotein subunit